MWWDTFSTRLLCPPATRLGAHLAGLLGFPRCPLCRCQLSIAFSKFPVLVMNLLLVAPVIIWKIQGRNKKYQKPRSWGKSCEAEVWLENIGHWHRDGNDLTCERSALEASTFNISRVCVAYALGSHFIFQSQKCVKTCVYIYMFL